ncbi:MAG: hypothetical protein WBI57_00955 [Desulfobacterales bacterium]
MEIEKNMFLQRQIKGKKVLLVESELQEYMSTKLNELSGLATNVVSALIMVTLVVVFDYIKAGNVFYFALILIPLAGRWYVGNLIKKWLKNKFKELLGSF